MQTITEVNAALSEFYTPSEIEVWWNAPHPQLESLPAITVWCGGADGKDKVRGVVTRLASDGYI